MPVGDIHWADLPTTGGREQGGHRPVMIFQDDRSSPRLPTVFVIPLTSSLAALRFRGTVSIRATPGNGLPADSVLLVFQLRALDWNRVYAQIGVAEPAVVAQAFATLDQLTGHP